MITWILDKHVDKAKGRPTPFVNEALKRGHIVYGLRDSIIPKSIDLTGIKITGSTIVRGSHGFVNFVQNELNSSPGNFRVADSNFTQIVYGSILGKDYCLNEPCQIVKYQAFLKSRKTFPGKIFVKPITVKQFNGIVLNHLEDLEAAHLTKFGKWFPPAQDDAIIISNAVEILSEYRIVVIDNVPITGSEYDDTKPGAPDDVMETAKLIAGLYNPAPAYVVDIAKTPNGNKVIEYNQFATSAMYACDQAKIVDALEKYLTAETTEAI